MGADELIFLLKDGRQIIAPSGWEGQLESLYERVRTFFHDAVSLVQALNRLVTGQDQGFLDYCEGVILSRTERDAINRYLDPQSGDPYQGEDQTIVHTVRFPDGKTMDIKCCRCRDEASWAEALLFDHHGRELCCSDACDEYEGVWDLQYDGILYTAIIKKEDE